MKKYRYQHYHYLKRESHRVCIPSFVLLIFFIAIVLCSLVPQYVESEEEEKTTLINKIKFENK